MEIKERCALAASQYIKEGMIIGLGGRKHDCLPGGIDQRIKNKHPGGDAFFYNS